MFSKNLKYYRLKKQLSKKALAEIVHVSPMAITNYEDGSRMPNMEMLKALAEALDIRVSDFLAVRNDQLIFQHAEFRKASSLTKMQQEYVRESVEEYFGRFMDTVEVLGGEVLPDAPACHALPLVDDNEKNAMALRRHLGFPEDGPIEDLIGKLENKGILVCECPVDSSKFSGMNGSVNGRPYVAINSRMNAERNRSTTVHELAHLMFCWPDSMGDRDAEKRATAIGGAFLIPKKDLIRELGVKRTRVSRDMQLVAKEYGISMQMLAVRAKQCGILSEAAVKEFFVFMSARGWRTAEPARMEAEHPTLFEQLVYRAVNEADISVQRGAELLHRPYNEVAEMSGLGEV